jgi:hypothetical protein
MTKILPVKMNVVASLQRSITIRISVVAETPNYTPEIIEIPVTLVLEPITLHVFDAIFNEYRNKSSNRIESFFDNDRELKTLLNFGNDYQALLTNWTLDPNDASGQAILVKLYRPLPDEVEEKTKLWITREISPPLNDKMFVTILTPPEELLFLRPPNRNVEITGRTGRNVDNRSLISLLSTSSFDEVKPNDPIVQEWYSHDYNLSELNVDYADYRKFVFFGSAQGRLNAFAEKLRQIENLDSVITANSSSLTSTGSAYITGTLAYPAIKKLADQRLELIRSFDGYERFLYYNSDTSYSSSLNTEDSQDAMYYHSDATWPKISGSVAPISSASNWLVAQAAIASAYDIANQNSLKNNIPEYLQSDELSTEFTKFLDLVGHQFDTLKVYIDHMPDIFDRDSDPSVGMSPDMVWDIAKSFGIDLPNQYSIKNLVDYTIGELGQVSPTVYRQVAAETWKRFLHNQIFLMKTKGTRQSLNALTNVYGVLPTTLQIRESATAGYAFPTGTFETYEEQTNALTFSGNQFIKLPTVALQDLKTVELRFATTTVTRSVLLQGDATWSVQLVPYSGTYGFINLTLGNVTTAQVGPMKIYSGDYYNLALVRPTTASIFELSVRRADHDVMAEEYHVTESVALSSSIMSAITSSYLGGSGSAFGRTFTGYVDEFRLWHEDLSDAVLDFHARYPGLYNGNTEQSSRDSLIVRLSFNRPRNLGSSSISDRIVLNESPFIRTNAASANLIAFTASNFANVTSFPYSMTVVNRTVQRFNPNGGSNLFSSNKVTIADPPELRYLSGDTTGSLPVLNHDRSIVNLQQKQDYGKSTNLVGFYFSLTNAINDSIVKSIGYFDVQNLIGDPADEFESHYASLQALNELYWNYYAYNFNVNSFVDFVRNLLDALFVQAKEMVPARAKLLTGIVHEPHILERAKVQHKPLEVSAGRLTRHNTDTYNLESEVIEPTPEWSAVFDNLNTTIPLQDSTNIFGTTTPLTALFEPIEDSSIVGNNPTYLTTIHVIGATAVISGTFPTYTTNLHRFVWEVFGPSKTSVNTMLPSMSFVAGDVKNTDNLSNVESYTYFSNVTGLVPIVDQVLQRANSNILRSRGIWTKGTVYSRNDYVIQSGSSGDAETGNDKEFLCISPAGTFASNIPPYLDVAHWTPMTYISTDQIIMKLAVLINNTVALVSPTNPGSNPIVTGYRPTHFKFYRDYRRGITNHQWRGCLQTDQTTPDGRPAVEITITRGDSLVVHDPTEPIQPVDNTSGPILDVQ